MNIRLGRNEACWCGSGQKYKNCHYELDNRLLGYKEQGIEIPKQSMIKNVEQIDGIRKSGILNIKILDYIEEHIKEGITTEQIDQWVYEYTTELGGKPATLGYEGYPKSVCTSINDQVCHGIPSDEVILKDGDIINVDVSTIYKGYYSDSSRMFCIGKVSKEKEKLVRVAKECIEQGVKEVKPFTCLGNIGQAIHDYAKKHGYSVVKQIGGHGVGLEFHEEPWVSYVSKKNTGVLMVPGMVFTIEPMINMGDHKVYHEVEDVWTIYTLDGQPSAQWEITVLVTDNGYEVLAY